MSRQHVMMIAEPSVATFLLGESDRLESAGAEGSRVRSKRAGAAATTTTAPKARVDTRWVNRRVMKRAG